MEHRGRRHAGRGRAGGGHPQFRAHADGERGILTLDGNARSVGAACGIGRRREFAQRSLPGLALRRPELDGVAPCAAKFRQAVFRNADQNLEFLGTREAHHGLSRGKHLPGLGLDRRNHAGMRGHQRGVGHRILRLGLLCARRSDLFARLARLRLAPVVFRLADEVARAQFGEALQVGVRERRLGLCLGEPGLRVRARRVEVAGVQHRDRLARAHARAEFDLARRHLAGHPEREPGFVARAHLAGKHPVRGVRHRDDLGTHRTNAFRRGGLARAAGQREQGEGSRAHDARPVPRAASSAPLHSKRRAASVSSGYSVTKARVIFGSIRCS